MKIYNQPEDTTVFGVHVKTFPTGIKEAFEGLIKNLGSNRNFYGVSWMDENNMVQYYAMAQEAFNGEAIRYNYETLTIEKGEYPVETVLNWSSKTDCIKDVFHGLIPNNRPDKNHPCIEWYKSDEEMLCLVKPL